MVVVVVFVFFHWLLAKSQRVRALEVFLADNGPR